MLLSLFTYKIFANINQIKLQVDIDRIIAALLF